MDPLTQGALGAALSQAAPGQRRHMLAASLFGFLAGMAADLDVLIRSAGDPLAFLEFHRHFSHALIFIPAGGFLCALVFHCLLGRRWNLTFLQVFLFSTLGYATHGLLDAATSYGTLLLWPFSDARVSWSIVSVIDPLFTVPLAVLVMSAAWKRKQVIAYAALGWAGVYIAAAVFQHQSAADAARQLAQARGHEPLRIEVKPSFGNIIVWKTIYETPERFYIDAVRAGPDRRVFEGVSVPKLAPANAFPWLAEDSQQARDIERFHRFSQGFIAQDPRHSNRIVDVRYSFIPNEMDALWSIELDPDAPRPAHARYLTHRNNPRENLARLWRMIAGP